MLLQLHEWGDRTASPVVALHGIGGFGRRFRKLAEERLAARFRVLAPDLRGHGSSSWEPPWTIGTHAADVVETIEDAGVERAAFVGHSYGGRLILELCDLDPERVERAVLLDPAVQLLPHVGFDFAERERVGGTFASPEDAIEERRLYGDPTPLEFIEEDVREHLVQGKDGLYTYRYCRGAVITAYGELCTPPPPPESLRVPTLLVHAGQFGLVREEQIEAYRTVLGDLIEIVEVPGGHMVFWDAFDEAADAVQRFLEDSRP
ncbi:MAG TPA: alpha/beta hydrolase [Gaiellaceae bacterium]|jgi:lipase